MVSVYISRLFYFSFLKKLSSFGIVLVKKIISIFEVYPCSCMAYSQKEGNAQLEIQNTDYLTYKQKQDKFCNCRPNRL